MPSSAEVLHFENRILASLPNTDLQSLQRHLAPVTLPLKMVLQEADQPSEYAYFIETGIASVVSTLKNGTTVEVGIIGRDGMVGLPSVMCTESIPFDCFIQMAGSGYRMKTARLKEHFESSTDLRTRLLCFAQAQFVNVGQLAVCNRIHEIQQRLARWLLLSHDRVDDNQLRLTHEFLATMLGAPRSTVTLAAGLLQEAGCIEYTRGRISIKDRQGLERSACECYGLIRRETKRLALL
jgi:CRP-like cAMP-binding protein